MYKICALFQLPPDHELIKEIERVFLQLEYENSIKETADMILKLDEMKNKASRLEFQVFTPIKTDNSCPIF